MATIAENLQRIQDAKADIAAAIVEKGGSVSGRIEDYADAVRALPSGGDPQKEIAFFNRTITEFVVPEGVTRISNRIFYQCTDLVTITLPTTLTSFDGSCIEGCPKLTTILGNFNNVTTTTGTSRTSTPPLKTINGEGALRLPNVVTIGNYTFCRFPADIAIIDIGNTCTSIGTGAFQYALASTLICRAVNPPTLSTNNINQMNSLTAIYVPDASVDAYKAATQWSVKASIIFPLSQMPQ